MAWSLSLASRQLVFTSPFDAVSLSFMKSIVSQPLSTRRLDNRIVIACAILAFQIGCSQGPTTPLPETYKVTGKVVDKTGQPLTYGSVEFTSLVEVKTQAVGRLQSDGTFSLHTYVDSSAVPGAIEGAHDVVFHPGIREQETFRFKGPFKVGPGENHFELTYPYKAFQK